MSLAHPLCSHCTPRHFARGVIREPSAPHSRGADGTAWSFVGLVVGVLAMQNKIATFAALATRASLSVKDLSASFVASSQKSHSAFIEASWDLIALGAADKLGTHAKAIKHLKDQGVSNSTIRSAADVCHVYYTFVAPGLVEPDYINTLTAAMAVDINRILGIKGVSPEKLVEAKLVGSKAGSGASAELMLWAQTGLDKSQRAEKARKQAEKKSAEDSAEAETLLAEQDEEKSAEKSEGKAPKTATSDFEAQIKTLAAAGVELIGAFKAKGDRASIDKIVAALEAATKDVKAIAAIPAPAAKVEAKAATVKVQKAA